ncbi:MAG: hypothetical protein WA709_39140 [Stellaceae bacterium]
MRSGELGAQRIRPQSADADPSRQKAPLRTRSTADAQTAMITQITILWATLNIAR